MHKTFKTFLLIATVIIVTEADRGNNHSPKYSSQPNDENNRQTSATSLSDRIAYGVLDLSKQLTTRVIEGNANKFEVISPISVASALQLALLGAKGETYEELRRALNLNDRNIDGSDIHREFSDILSDLKTNKHNEKRMRVKWFANASEGYIRGSQFKQDLEENFDHHKIEVANGIFVQDGFKISELYRRAVEDFYKSEVRSLNFKDAPADASQQINDWVNEKTHGKIKQIAPPVMNPSTRVVLANALYFKAQWQTTFFEHVTKPKKFFYNGRDKPEDFVMTELMASGGDFPHYYDPQLNIDILGLPYKQNATTMYVILPKDSNTERIKQVQKQLTAADIDSLIDKMTVKPTVMLIPKMHLKSGYHLKQDLQDLNVRSLFEEGASDLSLITCEQVPIKSDAVVYSESIEHFKKSYHIGPEKYLENNNRQALQNNSYGPVKRYKRDVTYKVESENKKSPAPLSVKDFFNRKRIVKNSHGKKNKRSKRQTVQDALYQLEAYRTRDLYNPHLFADEVIHKVDLTINEKGTEGGASTLVTINRSTTVVFRVDMPFMFLIRHDSTKTPLFYGVVFQPPPYEDGGNEEKKEKERQNSS